MVRINTIMREDLIKDLDRIARAENKSRSRLIREATEKLIEEYKRAMEERLRRERIKRSIAIQERLRGKGGKWNGVTEVRRWRERRC
jgi:metal-responsive CopG/Arc/MetJ family transcriptional regulator